MDDLKAKSLKKFDTGDWIIIGISGVTCGGKTTLSLQLKEKYPQVVIFKQDMYFHPIDSPKHIKIPELNHFNHDTIESLDMERMFNEIMEVVNPKNVAEKTSDDEAVASVAEMKILVIEGFIVLNYMPIVDICDLKYQMMLTREVCWSRRALRVWDRPEVPGYFDLCVWPESRRHNEDLKSLPGIKYLDGTDSDLLEKTVEDIRILREKRLDHKK